MIGATIGNYQIIQQIGMGGVGVVYLGQHTLLGRRAAIKVLLPEFSARPEIVNRFFNEARAVTAISDPGIVQVFDFGHHIDGSAFIVMELLEGEPMDRRLERIGRFGLSECLRLMQLMCASLAAVHARGIVHRDLKPENIFIVRDPGVVGGERAKLLDFGIAKLSTDEPGAVKTRTGALLGTPMYMSPEQCRGAGDVDHRSDIYTIGCVMFTMLTGRPPFERQDLGELIVAHLREPPPLASSRVADIPDLVDQILQRCLQKSPADRFPSMTELAEALAAAEDRLQRPSPATQAIDPAQAAPAPLPVQQMPSAVIRPQPTTLGASTGETTSPAPVRARRWGALVLSGALAVASTLVFVALWPGDGTSLPAASRRSTAAPPTEPAAIDAMPPGATHTDPAAGEPTAAMTTTVDAGVSDAAEGTDALPPPQPPQPKNKGLRSPPKGSHANSTTKRPVIDRGD